MHLFVFFLLFACVTAMALNFGDCRAPGKNERRGGCPLMKDAVREGAARTLERLWIVCEHLQLDVMPFVGSVLVSTVKSLATA